MTNINIFVSSTCYDLAQIRADISEFITSSGHNPILSESENFPISPELSTVENCIKIVKDNADILVLIIGSRYGSVIDNGKSITNNEFLVAKQKGIPIFCFIEKSVLVALNFWKNNKDGNFNGIVDNVQVFEFINEIRNNSKIWTFTFERAQEIISTLKIQLSYLFKDSLKVKKIYDDEISEFFKLNVSEKALKILMQKNPGYEYAFFAQVFVDEMEKREFRKNDIEYSILTEPKHIIHEYRDVPNWAQERISSFMNLFDGFKNLVEIALPKFFAEPGIPSDLKGLYYVALKYSELYDQLLNWILATRSAYIIGEDFDDLKTALGEFAYRPSKQIGDFPFEIYKQTMKACENLLLGLKGNVDVRLTLEIDKEAQNRLNQVLDRIKTFYRS